MLSLNTWAQETDIWSGTYVLKTQQGQIVDTLKIEKTKSLTKDKVAGFFEHDLERWTIASAQDKFEEKINARRFIFNPDEGDNEYEDFGWTEMHRKQEINCMDVGQIFICRSTPNTNIHIGEESFYTSTGIFGIKLHYGLFLMEQVE